MTYRVNGCGTTISPIPPAGEYSIAMHWITVLFVPIIPIGWVLILGAEHNNEYYVIKKMTYSEVYKTIGSKGMWLTIGYGVFTNILMLAGVCILYWIISFFK